MISRYCPKCGNEIKEENIEFCTECGYKFSNKTNSEGFFTILNEKVSIQVIIFSFVIFGFFFIHRFNNMVVFYG